MFRLLDWNLQHGCTIRPLTLGLSEQPVVPEKGASEQSVCLASNSSNLQVPFIQPCEEEDVPKLTVEKQDGKPLFLLPK